MKIKPVILCGGAGTRLWLKSKKNPAKQFIDFGGWTLFQKTLERTRNPIFDYPIISTNYSYLNSVRKYLAKYKINKYKIILEPFKKNTAAAILSSALLDEVPFEQPMIFFPADHLIEKTNQLNRAINLNKKHLDEDNIFIFGIKPNSSSPQYGYFLTKKISKGLNKVFRFIEKPNLNNAKKIIKAGATILGGCCETRPSHIEKISNLKH
jgi:mannose-1-phosphate guanylyltransferase/mannose-6-phosphate isomerase